jgi:hypothetical protein
MVELVACKERQEKYKDYWWGILSDREGNWKMALKLILQKKKDMEMGGGWSWISNVASEVILC